MPFPTVITSREPIPIDPLASLPAHVTVRPSELQITAFSVGIRRWIKRGCFEDKYSEYLPSEGGVQAQRITGSSLGVAALEYSEILDILAYPDYYVSDTSAKTDVPVVTIVPPSSQLNSETASTSQLPSSLSHMSPSILVRSHVSAVPSPLRNDALSSTSNREENGRLNTEVGTAPRLVRRGVHFAEDEDDALPLHIIRMKRKREERARFLSSEQRRRELEARQASQAAEDERRRRELERMEREKALQERKAKEDERKQRIYLEQVAAARLTRISRHRQSLYVTWITLPNFVNQGTGQVLCTTCRVHGRASSSPGSPPHSSSGSSRAPSDTGQPTGGRTYPLRPSSQSEDGLSGSRGKRDSAVAQGYLRPPTARNPTYPMWPNNFLAVPSMHVMPPYRLPMDPSFSMDMPLLPPVPPFMMQQYPRRSSRQSSPGRSNSSSSPVGTSINSSSERDDQSRRIGSSSSPSPSSSWSSGFFAASPSGRHSTVPHTESRRASMPPQVPKGDRPEATSASLATSRSARGRLQAIPQQQVQLPSPWTALPTQSGRLPMSMPLTRQENGAHGTNHGRKQTFIL
ncbi:hypothetical protein F5887DRAFT_1069095 [Amanita rubescens]|nr:hypothetical protein F5887DRAFT_1069095 [Amanita rubescens]